MHVVAFYYRSPRAKEVDGPNSCQQEAIAMDVLCFLEGHLSVLIIDG